MTRIRRASWIALTFTLVAGVVAGGALPDSVRAASYDGHHRGWAVGEHGNVWRSDSAGLDWYRLDTPVTTTLRGLFVADGWSVWVVGDDGTIMHTRDGGSSWELRMIEAVGALQTVWFANVNDGFVTTARGVVLVTNDGGATWTPVTTAELTRRRAVRRPSIEPATLVRVADVATFSSSHYGVSGTAVIVTDQLIRVSKFNSNGSAPGIDIRIGKSTESRRDFRVLKVIGRQAVGGGTLELEIPPEVTLNDFDTFTVWCFEFDVLIAEGRFQRP